jgi:hypothetical protein
MGLFSCLDESRAQLWASWGWLSLAFFLLIFVSDPRTVAEQADKNL